MSPGKKNYYKRFYYYTDRRRRRRLVIGHRGIYPRRLRRARPRGSLFATHGIRFRRRQRLSIIYVTQYYISRHIIVVLKYSYYYKRVRTYDITRITYYIIIIIHDPSVLTNNK